MKNPKIRVGLVLLLGILWIIAAMFKRNGTSSLWFWVCLALILLIFIVKNWDDFK